MKNLSLSKTFIAFIMTLCLTLSPAVSAQGESNQAIGATNPELSSQAEENVESDVVEVAGSCRCAG